jgi:DNA-binding Lrp family transcriptional regulator
MADLLDAQLHALHVDGRAPFSLIAEVLGVSDQTVARRYARLRSSGRLRIRAQTDAQLADQTQWIVRVQCAANTVALAQALARRPDTAWISLTSGGTEITATVRTRADAERDNRLLLETLPRSRTVTAVSAHCVLHTFFGNTLSVVDKSGPLTADQIERLRPPAAPARPTTKPHRIGPADQPLLAGLAEDGRASFTDLAAATGWSPSTVRRRVAELRAAGALYFDVDYLQELIDRPLRALLWLTIGLDRLDEAGRALAQHAETAYVASTTGAANLHAAVLCSDTHALYSYLTTSVAALPGLQHSESAPILRTVKRTGVLGEHWLDER